MKLTDENYCVTVVRIHNLVTLDGLDNLFAFPIYGFQALIGKAHKVGELGLLFTAESQLDPEYCSENNLYSDPEINKNKVKGYLGGNRRVRAIKLRGHFSSALFMPLSSLSYLGVDTSTFVEGDKFNVINGVTICKKYVVNIPRSFAKKNEKRVNRKIVAKMFPEHMDTSHWLRSEDRIDGETQLIATDKLHGTSCRLTHTEVTSYPKWTNRLPVWLAKYFRKTEWKVIAGSRRVVKIPNEGVHYYDTDVYNQTLEKYKHLIPKRWIIYGEIIGWAGEKEIQKNYSYGVPNGTHEFFVYRIAIINDDGIMVDLSYDQVIAFCRDNGMKYCPILWRGKKKDFRPQDFMDIKFFESGYTDCPKLGKNAPCDEGVVVRIEGLTPQLYKCKSPVFLGHETKMLDADVVSLEDEESNV